MGPKQTISWEEGNYQNLGPARLPSTHWTMLGYCRELGVALEVEINTSRSTFLQNDKANGGKPVVQRKAINDTRGHVSELLSKCIANGALDSELTKEDRERMMAFLKIYGPLNEKSAYVGSERAGYKTPPGAGSQVGVDDTPMDMRILLDENFWYDLVCGGGVGLAGDDDAAGGRDGPDSVCVCQGAGAGCAVQFAGDGDSEDGERVFACRIRRAARRSRWRLRTALRRCRFRC